MYPEKNEKLVIEEVFNGFDHQTWRVASLPGNIWILLGHHGISMDIGQTKKRHLTAAINGDSSMKQLSPCQGTMMMALPMSIGSIPHVLQPSQ